jgi:hypothetical protein
VNNSDVPEGADATVGCCVAGSSSVMSKLSKFQISLMMLDSKKKITAAGISRLMLGLIKSATSSFLIPAASVVR